MQRFKSLQFNLLFILSSSLFILMNCSSNNPFDGSGEWTSDIPFILNHVNQKIPHDNRIYETKHVLVFSDAGDDAVKRDFAKKAEKALEEVLQAFHISSPADIGIFNQDSKITVYTMKNGTHSQMAFPYGYLLHGLDSHEFYNWPKNMQPRFYKQMKHETVHVVQFLLGVMPNSDRAKEPHRWFNEGIAEYISGGFFIPIQTREQYELWISRYPNVNPISIHQWSDLPIPAGRVGEFYPMFGLAVKYLFDRNGLGRSPENVKNMFVELSEGNITFAVAFEKYMGISLYEYKETFFNRMEVYFK